MAAGQALPRPRRGRVLRRRTLIRTVNLYGDEWDEDSSPRPQLYARSWLSVGTRIGGTRLGASLYELPPGHLSSPYHYEYGIEEWLICVDGVPTLRTPHGERELRAGDTVCFPEGPAGAHQVINRSRRDARVLILSTKARPRIVVYPDSDKLAVVTNEPGDSLILRRGATAEYWDGEPNA